MVYMNLTKQQAIIVGGVFIVVVVFVLGFLGVIPGFKKAPSGDPNFPQGKIELSLWGFGDTEQDFSDVFKAYQGIHQNVRIVYTSFPSAQVYERELVNALAEGRGPDIFMIENTWVNEHGAKMAPSLGISPQALAQTFPDVVVSDVVRNGQTYALPLYMDSLALLYNKDLFNARAVLYPPQTWDDVISISKQLKELDATKKIQIASIALGGVSNISHVEDVVSVLMLQGGSSIARPDEFGGVRFDNAAQEAVSFYLQFSNPSSSSYTWNESFPNSRTAFADGSVAMIIDYHEALADIANKNPFLAVGTATLPQLNSRSPVGYVRYKALTVSRQASAATQYVGWDFITFATTNTQANNIYLEKTKRLPALRSGITTALGTEDSPFMRGALIARSWPQNDASNTHDVFVSMLSDILSGRVDSSRALRAAEEELNK